MTMNPVQMIDMDDVTSELLRDAYVITAAIHTRGLYSCLDMLASRLCLDDALLTYVDQCEALDMPITIKATGCGAVIGLMPSRAIKDKDLEKEKIRSYLDYWVFMNLRYDETTPKRQKLIFMLDEFDAIPSCYTEVVLDVINAMQNEELPTVPNVYIVGDGNGMKD